MQPVPVFSLTQKLAMVQGEEKKKKKPHYKINHLNSSFLIYFFFLVAFITDYFILLLNPEAEVVKRIHTSKNIFHPGNSKVKEMTEMPPPICNSN